MKPGRGKPHRSCAVRCISGGVPPALLVRTAADRRLVLLLTDRSGAAVAPQAVLDLVGEPVRVTGELVRLDHLHTLRIDPSTIERLD